MRQHNYTLTPKQFVKALATYNTGHCNAAAFVADFKKRYPGVVAHWKKANKELQPHE